MANQLLPNSPEKKALIKLGKTILPIWHGVGESDVAQLIPDLTERVGVSTAEGLDEVVIRILRAIRSTRGEAEAPWLRFRSDGWPESASIKLWLTTAEIEMVEPCIAWPGYLEQGLARAIDDFEHNAMHTGRS